MLVISAESHHHLGPLQPFNMGKNDTDMSNLQQVPSTYSFISNYCSHKQKIADSAILNNHIVMCSTRIAQTLTTRRLVARFRSETQPEKERSS